MSIDVKKLLESRPFEFVAVIELQNLKWKDYCEGCRHSFVATLDLPNLSQSDAKQILQSDYACSHYASWSSERYFFLYSGGVDDAQSFDKLKISVYDERFKGYREFKKNLKKEKKNGTPVVLSISATLQ